MCRGDDWKNGRWSHPECWQHTGDKWMTFLVALDFDRNWIETWARAEGEGVYKTHDAPVAFPSDARLDIVKLMINSSPHEGEADHPTFYWWYRNVIVSRKPVDMY